MRLSNVVVESSVDILDKSDRRPEEFSPTTSILSTGYLEPTHSQSSDISSPFLYIRSHHSSSHPRQTSEPNMSLASSSSQPPPAKRSKHSAPFHNNTVPTVSSAHVPGMSRELYALIGDNAPSLQASLLEGGAGGWKGKGRKLVGEKKKPARKW
jgi:hypothetical protein